MNTGPAAAGERPGGQRLAERIVGHLRAHRDLELTCWQLARVLGASPGAVAAACRRLAAQGRVVQTSHRPRRFRAAPAEDTA